VAEAVEFGLLGPLTVTIGGREVSIPAAKQRALLACLLLRPGELVTADELAEAIWGAALPANHAGFSRPMSPGCASCWAGLVSGCRAALGGTCWPWTPTTPT
jgi:hypothetical protein